MTHWYKSPPENNFYHIFDMENHDNIGRLCQQSYNEDTNVLRRAFEIESSRNRNPIKGTCADIGYGYVNDHRWTWEDLHQSSWFLE